MILLCFEYLFVSCIWVYVIVISCYSKSKRGIWSLSDCNEIRTHNQLIRRPILSSLAKIAKWLSCVVSYYLYDALDWMFLSRHACISEWIHSIFSWMLRKPLLETGANDCAGLWVLICFVHLNICSCHLMYEFQSESTLYIWLNILEINAISEV